MRAALDAAAGDREVRCVVVTGTGRGFCAGQDLADPAVAPQRDGAQVDVGSAIERYYKPLALRIRSMPVPVVAAVNGVAAGAGANFALLLRHRRRRALGELHPGVLEDRPDARLRRHLAAAAPRRPRARARPGDARATSSRPRMRSRAGLIWKCVDDAALPAEVEAIAARLASLPTRALVATRQALDAAQQLDLAAALSLEADVQRTLGAAPDFAEGVAAFMAKRAPTFGDR